MQSWVRGDGGLDMVRSSQILDVLCRERDKGFADGPDGGCAREWCQDVTKRFGLSDRNHGVAIG